MVLIPLSAWLAPTIARAEPSVVSDSYAPLFMPTRNSCGPSYDARKICAFRSGGARTGPTMPPPPRPAARCGLARAPGAVVAVPLVMIWSRRILLATALLLSACAGAQHRPENTSARVRDSAPEKAAAQRAATP